MIRHWLFLPLCCVVACSIIFGLHDARGGATLAGVLLLALTVCWLVTP